MFSKYLGLIRFMGDLQLMYTLCLFELVHKFLNLKFISFKTLENILPKMLVGTEFQNIDKCLYFFF